MVVGIGRRDKVSLILLLLGRIVHGQAEETEAHQHDEHENAGYGSRSERRAGRVDVEVHGRLGILARTVQRNGAHHHRITAGRQIAQDLHLAHVDEISTAHAFNARFSLFIWSYFVWYSLNVTRIKSKQKNQGVRNS